MNAVFPFRDGFYAHKGIVFLHPLNLPFIFVTVDRAGIEPHDPEAASESGPAPFGLSL